MTHTVFIRLDTLSARASQDDTALPSLVLTLCAAAKVDFAFITAADAIAPLDGTSIVVKCVVKAKPDNATALLLDASCDYNGEEAAAARYSAEWTSATLDGPALRDFLGSDISRSGGDRCGPWMEVEWTIDGATQRVAFPITIRNAWLRPEDTAPDPRADSIWAWFKSSLQVSGSTIIRTLDEVLKTITLSVELAIADVAGLQDDLDSKVSTSYIGANDGIAPLDSAGKVPSLYLPSYVDDVVEVSNFAALPGSGETGKIYVTLDTNKTYRWSGSTYVVLDDLPDLASQAEAEAGTDNSKLMTPQRTAQAIAALGGSGGGGTVLGRFQGVFTATIPATSPAEIALTIVGVPADGNYLTFTLNGGDTTFTFGIDIDISSGDPAEIATNLAAAIASIDGQLAGTAAVANQINIVHSGMGSGAVIAYSSNDGALYPTSATASGTDQVDGPLEVELVPGVAGKYPKMVGAWGDGNLGDGSQLAALFIRPEGSPDGSSDIQISYPVATNGHDPIVANMAQGSTWLTGYAPGASLVAKIVAGDLPADGSFYSMLGVHEQY